MQRMIKAVMAGAALALLAGCGINDVPTKGEEARAKWAQVQNQYQRRADLIPNLVETVKGYARQEEKVLTEVVQARASATQVKIDASTITDPEKFQAYQAAQDRLSGASGRLLAVSENYPDLKSNQNFLALQAQLEGTENRVTIARQDYIEAAKVYNLEFTTIPDKWVTALMYGSDKPMQAFTANAQAQEPPKVNSIERQVMTMGRFLWLLLALALVWAPAQAAPQFPALTGRVVDQAGVLDPATIASLDATLAAHEATSSDQVVVVTLKSLDGMDIRDYGYQLGRHWGIGQKGTNNGVILLVAPADRKVAIEVGYGLEGVFPDAIASVVINQTILPQFRAGDLAGGVQAGVTDILKVLTGDTAELEARAKARPERPPEATGGGLIGTLIMLAIIFLWLRSMSRRSRSHVILDEMAGGRRAGRVIPPIIWGGGGFGGGGFGGGGFGGGGGGFGGGGASGGW